VGTHQVQVRLGRASRRARGEGSLAARSAAEAGAWVALGAAAAWAGMRWVPGEAAGALVGGAAAAMAGALMGRRSGARLGAALGRFAEVVRGVAEGEPAAPLAEEPSGELRRAGEALNHLLVSWVAERRDLADQAERLGRQLGEARAAVAARAEQLSTFLEKAAQELRAPVLTLHGLANLLARDSGRRLDGAGREHLEQIRENASAAEAALWELLEAGGPGSGGETR